MEDSKIKKTLRITLGDQTVVDLVVEGSPDLVKQVSFSGYKLNEAISDFILNGFKLKAQYIHRDEKGKFVNVKEILEGKKVNSQK